MYEFPDAVPGVGDLSFSAEGGAVSDALAGMYARLAQAAEQRALAE